MDKNLLTMLNLFRGSNVTDPVDKIFGLLGLNKEINAEGTWGVDQLYPIPSENNGIDPGRVFISVARRIVERQRSFQLLGSVCHRGKEDASLWNLPSWVPYWTDRRSVPRPLTTTTVATDDLEVAAL